MPSADPFDEACWAYHEENDIDPLIAVLRSEHPLSAKNRAQLARLIDLLHALGQARRPGKPGGKHTRWNNPNYICAELAERRLAKLKQDSGRRKVSTADREKTVDDLIGEMTGWALTQRKRLPRKERVLALLREPKNRRL
jgi:hypothetical protein